MDSQDASAPASVDVVNLKQCPRCAEKIQAAAIVCRYCGFDYTTLSAPSAAFAPAKSTSGMAIASLVLGILWLYWIGAILALVFGYSARRQIAESGGRVGGGGMATAGIVLGWVEIGLGVVVVIVLAASGGSYSY